MGKRNRSNKNNNERKRDFLNDTVDVVEKKQKLSVLLLTVLAVAGLGYKLFLFLHDSYSFSTLSEKKSAAALKRRPDTRLRRTWSQENDRINDRNFFRLFRMSRPCFRKLCNKIEKSVGEKVFKSEAYLQELEKQGYTTSEGRMYQAHKETSSGYVPGEFKVAMSLRLMAGASYLDMFLWTNVSVDHVRAIFRMVVKHWFCNDDVIRINFFNVLQDGNELAKIRNDFGTKSDNVFSGVIGAVDGWLVRIRSPGLNECENPGKYFCRKGFYAINVQVIVDKSKRVLWRCIGAKGSSHDSPVFHESSLGRFLEFHAEDLLRHGIYLVGDSAYALRSYLLTPYDNASPHSKEDAFNFYLSSNRIYVECAFGEIDRRWGIFWKPLQTSLTNHRYVIDAGLRLHNFIVEFRNDKNEDNQYTEAEERRELDVASIEFTSDHPFSVLGNQSDEDYERRSRGRVPNAEQKLRDDGKRLRDTIMENLHSRGLQRPKKKRSANGVRDRFNRTQVA